MKIWALLMITLLPALAEAQDLVICETDPSNHGIGLLSNGSVGLSTPATLPLLICRTGFLETGDGKRCDFTVDPNRSDPLIQQNPAIALLPHTGAIRSAGPLDHLPYYGVSFVVEQAPTTEQSVSVLFAAFEGNPSGNGSLSASLYWTEEQGLVLRANSWSTTGAAYEVDVPVMVGERISFDFNRAPSGMSNVSVTTNAGLHSLGLMPPLFAVDKGILSSTPEGQHSYVIRVDYTKPENSSLFPEHF
jgi:hypothetical protein